MRSVLLFAALVCSFALSAQDCATYYFLQNNKTIEMTIYNRKGNVSGKQTYAVSDVQKNGDITTAHLNTEMTDEKGKSMNKTTANVQCDGGTMKLDMKLSMPTGQGGSQQMNTDVKMDNFYVEYPSDMKVGDDLKSASMNMDIDNKNGMKQNVTMDITDRKVEGKESVTTSAGTWECYKISFKSNMKVKTMGIGVPVKIDGTEWFAPGFGIVKTESKYGRTEITSVK